jgi:hypothetical protein
MNAPFDEELAALLAGAVVGEHRSLRVPDSELGQGLSAAQPGGLQPLLDGGLGEAVFLRARLAELEEVGLCLSVLQADPRVVKVSSVAADTLEVLGPGAAWTDPDDAGTVYVELQGSPRALVQQTSRCGVVLDGEGLGLAQLFLPLVREPFEPLASPVRAHVSMDPWLAGWAERRLQRGDAVAHAEAVGAAKRLWQPGSDARALALRVLAGEEVESLGWPHVWVRGLSAAQARAVERVACDRAVALAALLRADSQASELKQALLEREALEGVRVLLAERKQGRRLQAALEPVDRAGQQLRAERRLPAMGDGELDRRVRLLEPLAWWVEQEAEA